MGVGVWDPGAAGKGNLDNEMLEKVLAAAKQVSDENVSSELLKTSGLETAQWLMQGEASDWDIAQALDDGDLIVLTRFFTLVEQQVSGWDAGKKSPVIPLVKILKERGAFEAELRKWIKSNTDNRYLPNGSAL